MLGSAPQKPFLCSTGWFDAFKRRHKIVQTYANTGDKTVWVRGGPSGLDKRQCTALFADREPRVKPLLIFRGLGKRISLRKKVTIIICGHF